MRRSPTKRAFVIAGIGLLLILVGTTAQAGWLYVLAAGVLGLVVGSFFTAHRLRRVEVFRSTPRRMRVGDDVRVGIRLHNTGSKPVPMFIAEDAFAAFPPALVAVSRLAPTKTAEAELVGRVSKRGIYEGGRVTLRSAAPFGLIRSKRVVQVATPAVVVPRWVELTSFPLLASSPRSERVADQQARVGSGEEYLGIREYRPGDPQRSVHWRSTARAGRLIVREYNREISSPVGIVLAGEDHGEGDASSFEVLVSAVASIGAFALASGHPIYLVRAEPGGTAHLREPGKHELLDWLAGASPVDAELLPLASDALAMGGGQGTLIVCSSDSGTAGASAEETARAMDAAGARSVLVLARSRAWDAKARGTAVERAGIRWLEKDKELLSCLA